MKRRERISDGLRLKGWGKFFHGLFLFITFPIRKPLIFVPILMLGYLAPTFMGAKPTEVHLWYWNKIKAHSQNLGTTISEKTQEIIPDVDKFKISMPDLKSFVSSETSPQEKMVETTTADSKGVRRQMFEKAKEIPNAVNALRTAQYQETLLRQAQNAEKYRQNANVASPETVNDSREQTQAKLPLVYVSAQEPVTGKAEVVNANELKIGGRLYFLHGIYVNPQSNKGQDAKNFLVSIIGNNIIDCKVRAYTYQGTGTIICNVNGENINRLMVERGYSKNVDLD